MRLSGSLGGSCSLVRLTNVYPPFLWDRPSAGLGDVAVPRGPSLPSWGSLEGASMGIHLNSQQSPASAKLKNQPRCRPGPKSGGHRLPEPGWEGSKQSCQLRASTSHQHGAPASLLKDRLGRSLKDANVAADIWEILAGDQTRAENRSCWAGAGTRQQGPCWLGPRAQGLGSRSWRRLCFQPSPWVWGSLLERQGRRRRQEAGEEVGGEWMWRDLKVLELHCQLSDQLARNIPRVESYGKEVRQRRLLVLATSLTAAPRAGALPQDGGVCPKAAEGQREGSGEKESLSAPPWTLLAFTDIYMPEPLSPPSLLSHPSYSVCFPPTHPPLSIYFHPPPRHSSIHSTLSST